MKRKEEINDFIHDYLEQYNGDSYEAYAEKEDIARTCQNAIEWADETMLDKVCEWVKKHYIEYAHNRLGQEYIIEDLREAMKGE